MHCSLVSTTDMNSTGHFKQIFILSFYFIPAVCWENHFSQGSFLPWCNCNGWWCKNPSYLLTRLIELQQLANVGNILEAVFTTLTHSTDILLFKGSFRFNHAPLPVAKLKKKKGGGGGRGICNILWALILMLEKKIMWNLKNTCIFLLF